MLLESYNGLGLKDLQDHLVPMCQPWAGTTSRPRAGCSKPHSGLALNTFRDGGPTTYLGHPLSKEFLPIFKSKPVLFQFKIIILCCIIT